MIGTESRSSGPQHGNEEVFSLAYVSRPSRRLESLEMNELQRSSRTKNRSLSITGLLIWDDEWILQVLEGDEFSVRDLLQTIIGDERHEDLKVFAEAVSHPRRLSSWNMVVRGLRYQPPKARDTFRGLAESLFNTPIMLELTDSRVFTFANLIRLFDNESK